MAIRGVASLGQFITPEMRKRGRAVTDIRFAIKPNPQLAILDLDDGTGLRRAPVYDRLRGFGVSDRLARQWITQHGEDVVAQKLAYVEGQDDVRSPVGYLTAALRDDFGAEEAVKPQQPASARAKVLAVLQNLVKARTPTQRDADKQLFMSSLHEANARSDFERHGWMSALNRDGIEEFWRDLFPDAFGDI